jgi:hypothetical protein
LLWGLCFTVGALLLNPTVLFAFCFPPITPPDAPLSKEGGRRPMAWAVIGRTTGRHRTNPLKTLVIHRTHHRTHIGRGVAYRVTPSDEATGRASGGF